MAMCLCPYCNKEFYPFTSKAVDLKKLVHDEDVPFLISLPQVDSMDKLEPYFTKLAKIIISSPGKIVKPSLFTFGANLKRKGMRMFLDAGARILPKG
jgi:hypothetical protein